MLARALRMPDGGRRRRRGVSRAWAMRARSFASAALDGEKLQPLLFVVAPHRHPRRRSASRPTPEEQSTFAPKTNAAFCLKGE